MYALWTCPEVSSFAQPDIMVATSWVYWMASFGEKTLADALSPADFIGTDRASTFFPMSFEEVKTFVFRSKRQFQTNLLVPVNVLIKN